MKPAILLAARMSQRLCEALAERFELLGPLALPFEESVRTLSAEQAARVRAIISIGSVPLPGHALTQLPALELISCLGSGYEGVDLPAARARGLRITYSPNANAAAVADTAMGLLLESVRNLPAERDRLRTGTWQGNAAQPNKLVRGLTGRKVGIYGLGAIGLKIAQRAAAFETEIGYHNRKPRIDVPYPYYASLLELARWADVLMVAVRAGPENRHAVNAQVLAALGAQGHVVNISRGSVIDEAALVAALQDGTIAGAGLDVFEHEPRVPAILFDLPHVAVTPHLGGATLEAQDAMRAMLLTNVFAHFDGLVPPNLVPELSL
jgi:lactate dehydrogenase-like 2-hydroxyacid dehydrogenase